MCILQLLKEKHLKLSNVAQTVVFGNKKCLIAAVGKSVLAALCQSGIKAGLDCFGCMQCLGVY